MAKPILYAHPFSSYCWKPLIALWENGSGFDYRHIEDDASAAEWAKLSPAKRMPLLVDGDTIVPEATIIVEYMQLHHPGPVPMLPADPQAALDVRLLDRMSDNYLMTPMQRIVSDALREAQDRDPFGVVQGARTARHRLSLVERAYDGARMGRRYVRPRRLRDGAGLILCGLGASDRRGTRRLARLSRPIAVAAERGAGRGGGAAVPQRLPARRSGAGLDSTGSARAGSQFDRNRPPFYFPRAAFSATAARISALSAGSSTTAPSWKSIARRTLPSRLALNRPAGSSSEAPLAKVIFTAFL